MNKICRWLALEPSLKPQLIKSDGYGQDEFAFENEFELRMKCDPR